MGLLQHGQMILIQCDALFCGGFDLVEFEELLDCVDPAGLAEAWIRELECVSCWGRW